MNRSLSYSLGFARRRLSIVGARHFAFSVQSGFQNRSHLNQPSIRAVRDFSSFSSTSPFSSSSSFSSSSTSSSPIEFEKCSEETLESLGEHLEQLLEADHRMTKSDVELSNGVLTATIPGHGTYVINKQTPNQQIWLSSPISGPARFDLVEGKGWYYKRTEETLHELLNREVGRTILKIQNPGFENCFFGTGTENH